VSRLTAAELAWQAGSTPEHVDRLAARGIIQADPADGLFDSADIHRVRLAEAMLHALVSDFGLDHDSVVAGSRFFGENLRRMAESQVRFFRSRVIDRLRAAGMPWAQVLDTIGPIAAGMRGGSDELRAQLYDRHLEDYIFQQAVEMFEATMEEAGYDKPRPVQPPAIAFLDMGGYTLLTQKAGDEAAAELAAKLVGLVWRASRDYGGEAVKLLGDGVMFHFPQADKAVACGLELVEVAEHEGLPPARMGADAGPVVFRDGDYFGQTVNVAARISDYARPGEVLVSQAVIEEVPEAGFEFRSHRRDPAQGRPRAGAALPRPESAQFRRALGDRLSTMRPSTAPGMPWMRLQGVGLRRPQSPAYLSPIRGLPASLPSSPFAAPVRATRQKGS